METASTFSLPLSVFISCASSNEDEKLLQKFEKHLGLLKKQGIIELWHHRKMLAGTSKQQELHEHLLSASLILLLMSVDFFHSDDCEKEMDLALARRDAGTALVIPILLHPVDLHGTSIETFVCLPRDKEPVALWKNKDEAFTAIVTEIRKAIEQHSFPQNKRISDKGKRLRALISDHNGFLKDRLESFVGRQKELAEIQDHINQRLPTGGYITITGQAGQGKSSIIAKLIETYGVEQVAYHFIPINPGPDHQVGLLRNLMARLILKYDLSDLYVASDNRAALRDYFPKVLTDIANQCKQEIICIDGLDQLEEDFNGVRDLSFLPVNPPSGIVFVLGTRSNDTMKPLELLKPLDQYLLPNLSRQDFNLILEHRQISLEKHLVDRFYQAMEENALYLDLVAKELKSSHAIEPLAMIKRITTNPTNIFSFSIERLKQKEQLWERVIYPVLGVLLAIQEPVALPCIKEILQVEDYKLRDGLTKLGGLLTEDPQRRYSLLHLKLRDYLRQDVEKSQKEYVFSIEEEEGWHERLAVWCEQGQLSQIWQDVNNPKEQGRRIYARQHYITHLFYARKWQQLFDILDKGIYGRAKVQYDPSTRSYIQDLDRGRQAVVFNGETLEEKIAILPRLWRYTLLRSSLRSHANQYSREMFHLLLLLGREADVLGLAELLTDPSYKIEVLLLMAEHLAKLTESKTDITQIFLRIFEVAQSIEDENKRVKALSTLSNALTQAGRWEQAQQVALSIEDENKRAEALNILANALTQAGCWEQAQQITQLIKDGNKHAKALSALASALAQAGRWEQGQRIAQSIEDDYRRTEALSILASALAQAGRWEQAQQIAQSIEGDYRRTEALNTLASALAQAGRWKQAQQIAQSIEDDYWRTKALSALANALTQAECWEQAQLAWIEAQQIAQSIEDKNKRLEALSSLVTTLAQAGRWKQAQQIAQSIEDDYWRSRALSTLVSALAQAGHQEQAQLVWIEAQQIVQSIGDKNKRVEALSALIMALAQGGYREQAQLAWIEAQQIAQSIEDGNERAEALSVFASVLTQARHWEQARQAAQSIEDRNKRAKALSTLANTLAHAGHWEQAQQVAQSIEDRNKRAAVLCNVACLLVEDQQKKRAEVICTEVEKIIRLVEEDYLGAKALSALASALAQSGHWGQAQQVAQSIEDGGERAEALSALASALAQSGHWGQAQQLAQSIENEDERAEALSALASALAQSGHWEQALQVAQLIEDEDERLEVLSTFASALAQSGHWERAQLTWIEARQVTRFIKQRGRRTRALSQLASALMPWRQAKWIWIEAQQVAQSIEDGGERAEALSTIANTLTHMGHWKQALQVAQSIEDADERAEALRNLANALAHAGHWEQAQQVAQSIEDENRRVEALNILASALAQSKHQEQVQPVTYSIENYYQRAEDWSFLTLSLDQMRQQEQAQPATYPIEQSDEKAKALSTLANVSLSADEYGRLISKIHSSWLQVETRRDALLLFSLALRFISLQPEIGIGFYQGFKWVDTFWDR